MAGISHLRKYGIAPGCDGGPPSCIADPYYSCGPTNDPYWDNVVLMLHAEDGITDSSQSARVPTTAVGITQNLVEFKFGAGALECAASTDVRWDNSGSFQLGAGNWTIECWIWLTPWGTSQRFALFQNVNLSGASGGVRIRRQAFNDSFEFQLNGSYAGGSGNLPTEQWVHFAVVRSGGEVRAYVNGVNTGTPRTGLTVDLSGDNGKGVSIGNITSEACSMAGVLIDEYRVTKGVARYTGNFNIPTEAFPDAQEAEPEDNGNLRFFMRAQDNFRDLSILNVSPTIANTTIEAFASPAGSAESFFFNGTSCFVNTNTLSSLPAFYNLRDSDFTIDFWAYASAVPTTGGQYRGIIGQRNQEASNNSWYIYLNGDAGGKITAGFSTSGSGTTQSLSSDAVFPTGEWVHVAVCREGATVKMYLDGVAQAATIAIGAASFFAATTFMHLGRLSGGIGLHYFSGYLDAIRVAIGGSRWSADFTPPTDYILSVFAEPRTVLSLHAEDTTDASCWQPKTVTLAQDAVVSADEFKFNASSFYVPSSMGAGSTHGAVVADHQDFDMGTLDWTLGLWAYRINNDYAGRLFTGIYATSLYAEVGVDGLLDVVWVSDAGSIPLTDLVSVPLAQWNHFVFQRRGGTVLEVYLNGTLISSSVIAVTARLASTGPLYLGRTSTSSTSSWNGYIDEVNLVRGAARYLEFIPNNLPWCDSTSFADGLCPGDGAAVLEGIELTLGQGTLGPGLSDTSGEAELTGISLVLSQGTLLLPADVPVALSGISLRLFQGALGALGLAQPTLRSAKYTKLSLSAPGAANQRLVIRFKSDGRIQLSENGGAFSTDVNWASPTDAGYAGLYELVLSGITTFVSPGSSFTAPTPGVAQVLASDVDISLLAVGENATVSYRANALIRPTAGSPFANLTTIQLNLTANVTPSGA